MTKSEFLNLCRKAQERAEDAMLHAMADTCYYTIARDLELITQRVWARFGFSGTEGNTEFELDRLEESRRGRVRIIDDQLVPLSKDELENVVNKFQDAVARRAFGKYRANINVYSKGKDVIVCDISIPSDPEALYKFLIGEGA